MEQGPLRVQNFYFGPVQAERAYLGSTQVFSRLIETSFTNNLANQVFFETGGALEQNNRSNAFRLTSWNPIPSTTGDVEVLAKITSDTANVFGVSLRAGTTIANGYTTVVSASSNINRLGRTDAGTFTIFGATGPARLRNAWYWVRMRANGNTISSKVWWNGDPEPADWQLTQTDSTYSTGLVGLYSFSNDSIWGNYCSWFGVGLNGASAPAPGDTLGANQSFANFGANGVSDWTRRYVTTSTNVNVQTPQGYGEMLSLPFNVLGSTGDQILNQNPGTLQLTKSTSGRQAVAWLTPGRIADCDVKLRMTIPGSQAGQRGRILTRASNIADTHYICEFQDGDKLNISKRIAGSYSLLATTAYTTDDFSNGHFMRFSTRGNELKAKAWRQDASEPSSWMLETTDSDITEAGWIGADSFPGAVGQVLNIREFNATTYTIP